MRALETPLTRRDVMAGAGSAAAAAFVSRAVHAETPVPAPDQTIRIAPIALEIAPGKVIKTTAYNGSVPGPVLRLREGRPAAIQVISDSGYPNLIHWHGLMIPSRQDGATEEGSPIIASGGSLLYSFMPKPSAFLDGGDRLCGR